MYQITVKLKQHTPLIHFQHDQEGATLRASEVKPKLDKFIFVQMGEGKYEEGVKKAGTYEKESQEKAKTKYEKSRLAWLIGKKTVPALNYKMRIVSDDSPREYLLASYINDSNINALNSKNIVALSNTPFFAQEKQNGLIVNNPDYWNTIEKKGLLFRDAITLTILSTNEQLIDTVSDLIQSFFIATNFGTRQSKGFGSFSVCSIRKNDIVVRLALTEDILKKHFVFVYKKLLKFDSLKDIFHTINNDYRLLKSGFSRPYKKSLMMRYADRLDETIGWDKKYIKYYTTDAFSNEDGQSYRLKDSHRRLTYGKKQNYRFFRALLGLAEQYEFLLDNPPIYEKDGKMKKGKMIVSVYNEDIQRFQSPLLFKVIDKSIYLVGNTIPKEMLDKCFLFKVNFQGDSGYKDELVSENGIWTPKDFSLEEFVRFAMADEDSNFGYERIK